MIISCPRKSLFFTLLFGLLLLGPSVRSEEQHVFPEDDGIEFGDNFGANLAIDGDWAVAGVPNDSMNGITRVGSAYVLKRVAGSWETHAKLLLPAAHRAHPLKPAPFPKSQERHLHRESTQPEVGFLLSTRVLLGQVHRQ